MLPNPKVGLFTAILAGYCSVASAECLVYTTSSSSRPSQIPSTAVNFTNKYRNSTNLSLDTSYEGLALCATGTWKHYYDSWLNVYRTVYSCLTCGAEAIKLDRNVTVGSCNFTSGGTSISNVAYYCEHGSGSWTNKVLTSLPSNGTVVETHYGSGCSQEDSVTYYVKAAEGNTYHEVRGCKTCPANLYPQTYVAGNFSLDIGKLFYMTCSSCSAGYGVYPESDGIDATVGTVGCVKCPKGSYSGSNSYKCLQADKGYFVSKVGATSQVACAKGAYTNVTGSSACSPCQNGTTTTGTASVSCSASCSNSVGVYAWNTATWSENTVSGSCSPKSCKAGYKYSTSSCTACEVGKYQDTNGSTNTSCTTCPAVTDYWADSGLSTRPSVTTSGVGNTALSSCYVDADNKTFYDASGGFVFADVQLCSYFGTGAGTSISGTSTDCATVQAHCLTNPADTARVALSDVPGGTTTGGGYCWCSQNNMYMYFANMGSASTCASACQFQCEEMLIGGGNMTSMGCARCSDVQAMCKVSDLGNSVGSVTTSDISSVPSGSYCFCGINGNTFFVGGMGTESECSSNCAAQCKNYLTDADYISIYDLPTKVSCM